LLPRVGIRRRRGKEDRGGRRMGKKGEEGEERGSHKLGV